jgi:hypothetical protein
MMEIEHPEGQLEQVTTVVRPRSLSSSHSNVDQSHLRDCRQGADEPKET